MWKLNTLVTVAEVMLYPPLGCRLPWVPALAVPSESNSTGTGKPARRPNMRRRTPVKAFQLFGGRLRLALSIHPTHNTHHSPHNICHEGATKVPEPTLPWTLDLGAKMIQYLQPIPLRFAFSSSLPSALTANRATEAPSLVLLSCSRNFSSCSATFSSISGWFNP